MAEQIINASGPQYGLVVNSDGSVNVSGTVDINNISGSIIIGSVSASVDSIYVQSGTMYISSGNNLTGSFTITTDPVPISGLTNVKGYTNNEIIRKDAGSPAINYIFNSTSESVMVDNLGSSNIYFAFDTTANPVNSGTGFLDKYSFRVFDVIAGSVSVQGSGTTTPSVQVIRLS
tara:strand:+ start:499 stop:1023 length:525 start_codon:yes stop_codon:yes gene_type:complete